jgi:uncharacterized glyoxalase superfamily protein PhnB
MIYVDDLERAMAYYRDSLGFEVSVFGQHEHSGEPFIAWAKLEDAYLLLTNEVLFQDGGQQGRGPVRLYFNLDGPVDDLHLQLKDRPEVDVVQSPTDQHWGQRTLIVRDPWGVLLVFSNMGPAA